MNESLSSPVTIQTASQSVPSTPSWFGEVTVIAQYLRHLGVLSALEERVRFARRRFGHYDPSRATDTGHCCHTSGG